MINSQKTKINSIRQRHTKIGICYYFTRKIKLKKQVSLKKK